MAWVPIITTNLPPHLASFKGFVEAQGGAVAAGDHPGGGAVFTIRLRLAICIGASSVPNRQFVAQKVVATDSVDGSFVPPSSAALLAVCRLKMRGDRPGEFVAQIKIPAKALCISAIKAEQGFGMSHVDGIFERTPFARTGGFEMLDFHGQGF